MCPPAYSAINIHSTTFLGNVDTIFLSRQISISFISLFYYHITIVHKEEARERLCELANGMRGVHSLREETILLFYSCIYLAFWVISIGLFQHTRQEEGILSALQGDLFAFSAV